MRRVRLETVVVLEVCVCVPCGNSSGTSGLVRSGFQLTVTPGWDSEDPDFLKVQPTSNRGQRPLRGRVLLSLSLSLSLSLRATPDQCQPLVAGGPEYQEEASADNVPHAGGD